MNIYISSRRLSDLLNGLYEWKALKRRSHAVTVCFICLCNSIGFNRHVSPNLTSNVIYRLNDLQKQKAAEDSHKQNTKPRPVWFMQ